MASHGGADRVAEQELRTAMHAALAGGTAVVVATVSNDGVPATALCTWVVSIGASSIAVALDRRSSAFANISAGSTLVALEVLADDLVIAARGKSSISIDSMVSVPFPCAAIVVTIDEIRDHSVRGIRFHAPTYAFAEDKEHRGNVELAVFAELAAIRAKT